LLLFFSLEIFLNVGLSASPLRRLFSDFSLFFARYSWTPILFGPPLFLAFSGIMGSGISYSCPSFFPA